MKYLFFDLECANCFQGNGKICEFGYILTDSNFNKISSRDIPISPGDKHNKDYKFDNRRFSKDKYFERWYDEEEYYNCPEFTNYYDFIYNLLTDKDTLVFGFAVDNDIRYIDYACKRYNLPRPKYLAIDSKVFVDAYKAEHKEETFRAGLDDSFIRFCSINEFIRLKAHKASDDAYMTMRVVKEMMNVNNLSIDNLINKYPHCRLDSIEYADKYNARKQNRIEKTEYRNKCHDEWMEFINSYPKDNINSNAITLSHLLLTNIDLLHKAFEFIKSNNYIPVSSVSKSNYVLVKDSLDQERLSKLFKQPYKGQFITLINAKE